MSQEEWTLKEKLCLIHSIVKFGCADWEMANKYLPMLCSQQYDRQSDFYSATSCSTQYAQLIDEFACNKNTLISAKSESKDQIIMRQLTFSRIEQLKNNINENIIKLNLLAKKIEQINSGQLSSVLNDENIETNSEEILSLIYKELHEPNFESADSLEKIHYQINKNIKKNVTPEIPPTFESIPRRIRVPQSLQEPIESISGHGSPLNSDSELDLCVSGLEYSSEIFDPKIRRNRTSERKIAKKSSLKPPPPTYTSKRTQPLPRIVEDPPIDMATKSRKNPKPQKLSMLMVNEPSSFKNGINDDKSINKTKNNASSASSTVSIASFSSGSKNERNWRKSVSLLLKHIGSYRYAYTFLAPAQYKIAGYCDIIKHPRDLKTLIKEVECGLIKNFNVVHRDILLMFQNALMYSRSDTDIYLMTCQMFDDATIKISEYLESIELSFV